MLAPQIRRIMAVSVTGTCSIVIFTSRGKRGVLSDRSHLFGVSTFMGGLLLHRCERSRKLIYVG